MFRAGIIGCGNIAAVHAWAISQLDDVSLKVLCDVKEQKADRLLPYADRDVVIVRDWKMLFDPEIDVVHICTPHYLHAPMAAELLDHGKYVFLEKPCAISRESYEFLKQADLRNPGHLGICFQNRYNQTTLRAEQILRDGGIGEIRGARAFVTWRRDEDYYSSGTWRGKKKTEGGGALINQAIHTFDLLLKFLGKPERVESTISNHHLKDAIEVEDTVEAWLSFKDGKRACFYASNGFCCDAPNILEIYGEKGQVVIRGEELYILSSTGGRGSLPALKYQEDHVNKKVHEHDSTPDDKGMGKGCWGVGHLDCIRDFYNSIKENREFAVDLKSTEKTFDILMKIYGN